MTIPAQEIYIIPGYAGRLEDPRIESSRSEAEESTAGSFQLNSVPRQFPWPSVLLNASEESSSCLWHQQSVVRRGALPPVKGSQEELTWCKEQLEWEKPDFTEPRHPVQMLPRSGGEHRTRVHRQGALVQTGEGIFTWFFRNVLMARVAASNSRQLIRSGVTGDNSSRQNIPEKLGKQTCTAVNRQSNGSLIHKPGRDSLRPSNNPGERALDVVPGEGHPTLGSIISFRRGKHQGRHRITGDEGSLQLDAKPSDIPEDSGSLPGLRQTCLHPTCPSAPKLLQLETRPSGRSHRCLSPGLEGAEGIHELSMESCRPGAVEGGGAGSGASPRSSNMALPTVVSQVAQPVGCCSSENPSSGGDDVGMRGASSRDNPASSSVAYLQQHYSNKISGEAMDLLLSS